MGATRRRAVPRITLTRAEAATALGMSLDSFERHVQPEVKAIYRGKLRLYRISELERWAERNETRPEAA